MNESSIDGKFGVDNKDRELLKGIAVLYVEDEPDIRDELSLILKRWVGTLYTAADGAGGLEAFKKYRPDIVITDIRMPRMDGLTMSSEIKKAGGGTPIVVTTASNEVDSLITAIDIGIDKYVLKPTEPKVLIKSLCQIARALFQKREIENKNRYIHFILDISPGFIVATESAELEYINKAFLRFLGQSSIDEFMQSRRRIEDFIVKVNDLPYPDEKIPSFIQYVIAHRETYHTATLKSPQADGGPKVFLITYDVFPSLDKYVLFFTDITGVDKERSDLKRLSDKLLEAKAYAENIVDTVHESLLVIDAQLRVISANRSFYESFHVTPAETENHPLHELGGRLWDIPLLRELLEEVMSGNTNLTDYAIHYAFPKIGERIILLSTRKMAQSNGRPALILLSIKDITERKQLEMEKTKLIEDLKSSLEKVRLLSGMLPICASCKRIRNDKGFWDGIEKYIEEHSEAIFTHSICQDCAHRLYPELYDKGKLD